MKKKLLRLLSIMGIVAVLTLLSVTLIEGVASTVLAFLDEEPKILSIPKRTNDGERVFIDKELLAGVSETVLDNLAQDLIVPDLELIFRVRKNTAGGPIAGHWGINSLGFRSPEFPSTRHHGLKRLLIIGDSVTFSHGISDHRKTIIAFLYREFEKKGSNVEIFNLSQPGFSSTQGLVLFKKWFPRMKPDLVIASFGWNDIWEAKYFTDRETIGALKYLNSTVIQFAHKTAIGRLARRFSNETNLEDPSTAISQKMGQSKMRVNPAESKENYLAMIKAAQNSGVPFLILKPPTNEKDLYDRITKHIASLEGDLVEAGAIFLEFKSLRPGAPNASGDFQWDGYHVTPRGARTMAQHLAKETRKYLQ